MELKTLVILEKKPADLSDKNWILANLPVLQTVDNLENNPFPCSISIFFTGKGLIPDNLISDNKYQLYSPDKNHENKMTGFDLLSFLTQFCKQQKFDLILSSAKGSSHFFPYLGGALAAKLDLNHISCVNSIEYSENRSYLISRNSSSGTLTQAIELPLSISISEPPPISNNSKLDFVEPNNTLNRISPEELKIDEDIIKFRYKFAPPAAPLPKYSVAKFNSVSKVLKWLQDN
ncbi:MAG: hypothetical protein PF689_05715 [Deltaproteobacteria bacterium]|jgi:hypothetical protein|nr:hypothetical protein [Deltaproteobacteria bacterium]